MTKAEITGAIVIPKGDYLVGESSLPQTPEGRFHEMTLDKTLYDEMMQMTVEGILEKMGIPNNEASERLKIFIQDTLDIEKRRQETTRTSQNLGRTTIRSTEHERRTA